MFSLYQFTGLGGGVPSEVLTGLGSQVRLLLGGGCGDWLLVRGGGSIVTLSRLYSFPHAGGPSCYRYSHRYHVLELECRISPISPDKLLDNGGISAYIRCVWIGPKISARASTVLPLPSIKLYWKSFSFKKHTSPFLTLFSMACAKSIKAFSTLMFDFALVSKNGILCSLAICNKRQTVV